MSWQNIPLKGRTDFRGAAEFRPQRLFAFELRRWEAQLGLSARISAGCLRCVLALAAERAMERVLGLAAVEPAHLRTPIRCESSRSLPRRPNEAHTRSRRPTCAGADDGNAGPPASKSTQILAQSSHMKPLALARSLQAQPSRSYQKPHPSALDSFVATTWKAKQRAPPWQKRTFA